MATADLIDFELQKIIRLLPGYDPFAQKGDCEFDPDAAQFHIDFVQECCTHVKGEKAGTPLILEPWQKAIFANLFGWKHPDGKRRYREALIYVPRGNSKTTMAAAIVNIGLYLDTEPGAELYSSAAERDQARLCFDIVTGMIRAESRMADRAKILDSKHLIIVEDRVYKALSAEAGTKHGFSPQLIVNDELHAQKTPELTEVLMTGTGKRTQPLTVHLTTADYEREGSICNDKHDYACKVRDGIIDDPAFLPVIYEAQKDADWTDPKVWAECNPNLDVSVSREYLKREIQRAKDDPAFENTLKRLHFNIRTEALARWVTTEAWDSGETELDLADFAGQRCWIGLDLASTQDFTALVIAFRTASGCVVFPFFWVPRATAEKRDRETRIPYIQWANDGYLRLTEARSTDYDTMRRDFNAIVKHHRLNVQEIAADQLFQGVDICRRLEEEDGYTIFAHGMGMLGMALPTKQTKELIIAGTLQHSGHPVLRWMVSNTVVRFDDAGNERPSRDKSSEKIDGTVATIMTVGRAMLEEGGNAYDEHDVREIDW